MTSKPYLIRFVLTTLSIISLSRPNKADENGETRNFTEWRMKYQQIVASRDDTQFRERLLHQYQAELSPPWRVAVYLYYTLLRIVNIDEKSEHITTAVQLTIEWEDDRLKWDAGQILNNSLIFPKTKLWSPHVVHYNSIYGQYSLFDKNSQLKVDNTGMVKLTGAVVLTSPCELDIFKFPLDVHICEQQFRVLPAYSSNLLEGTITHGSDATFTKDSIWNINRTKDIQVMDNSNALKQVLKVRLRISRKYQYYISRLLAPLIIFSVLIMLVFFIPPDVGEKIALGVTLLLTFTVFQITINDDLPATSTRTPLVIMAMVLLQVCSGISIITSVIVLSIHYGSAKYSTRMPRGVRFMFFNMISYITCYRPTITKVIPESQVGVKVEKPEAKEKTTAKLRATARNTGKKPKFTKAEALLKKLNVHLQMKDRQENEWKIGAMILDRTMMYLCLGTLLFVYTSLFIELRA